MYYLSTQKLPYGVSYVVNHHPEPIRGYSAELTSLIERMLDSNPSTRITAEQILPDPTVQSHRLQLGIRVTSHTPVQQQPTALPMNNKPLSPSTTTHLELNFDSPRYVTASIAFPDRVTDSLSDDSSNTTTIHRTLSLPSYSYQIDLQNSSNSVYAVQIRWINLLTRFLSAIYCTPVQTPFLYDCTNPNQLGKTQHLLLPEHPLLNPKFLSECLSSDKASLSIDTLSTISPASSFFFPLLLASDSVL